MSLILNIDTTTEHASICLADDSSNLFVSSNDLQKEHASWLHPIIKKSLEASGKKATDLVAIGITAGPGSYTGLRVAMATAKGLCYALNIPLIAINTLEAMASIAVEQDTDYICPMIDARRMEVFTALYDKKVSCIINPCTIILDEKSFYESLQHKRILFFGTGKNKFEKIIFEKNAIFKNLIFNASHLASITYRKYTQSEFNSLHLTEPLYIKEHHTLFISKS